MKWLLSKGFPYDKFKFIYAVKNENLENMK